MKTPIISFIFLFLSFSSYNAYNQCTISIAPGSFTLVDEGNCNYHISVSTAKSSGNPSAQIYWGCGSSGTGAPTPLLCINNWNGSNVFKTDVSGTITCGCGVNIYSRIVAFTSSNCGGSSCVTQTATNLAITLSAFNLSTSLNKKEVCLSWQLLKPDVQNQYLVESSEDGIYFQKYGIFTENETIKTNDEFKLCLEPKAYQNYFRLKVIEPDGSITLSPIRKIDLSRLSLAVAVDHANNRLKIFGTDPANTAPYDILNVYGQSMAKGVLTSPFVALPSLAKGMYILQLRLPTSDVPFH